jgi:hypothetical protein
MYKIWHLELPSLLASRDELWMNVTCVINFSDEKVNYVSGASPKMFDDFVRANNLSKSPRTEMQITVITEDSKVKPSPVCLCKKSQGEGKMVML